MATTHKTWTQALDAIDETFRKWSAARNMQITSQVVGRTSAQLRKSVERATDDVGEREVTLSFTWRPVGQPERSVRLATAHETRLVANVAHLAQAVETLRLAEVRGVHAVLASAYRQLEPAPSSATPCSPCRFRADASANELWDHRDQWPLCGVAAAKRRTRDGR